MLVGLLTREYPPDVYGGAGVHVEFLARELRSLVDLDVHCWGPDRPDGAHGHRDPHEYSQPAFATIDIAVSMAEALQGHDLAHSHTWYANLGGHLAKLTHGIPHVITAHSLEPLRPWKAELLGGGADVGHLSVPIDNRATAEHDHPGAQRVHRSDLRQIGHEALPDWFLRKAATLG